MTDRSDHDADRSDHDADRRDHDADLRDHDGPIRAITMGRFPHINLRDHGDIKQRGAAHVSVSAARLAVVGELLVLELDPDGRQPGRG